MTPVEGLAYGFSVCLVPENVIAVFVGVLVGTLIGVLPGIGPVGTMAMLMPLTFKMGPAAAIIMFAGIFYGSMYGGSTTSILVNVPGEATAVVTTVEGYQMAQKGRAGAALAVAAVGSWVAGTLGVVGLTLFAPALAKAALSIGPPEFFSIALCGLFTLSRISGGPFWQSLLVLALGLMLATIGVEPLSGIPRYTFGVIQLSQGIELVAVVMGLYGIAEVLSVAEQAGGLPRITKFKLRELFPTRSEWRRSWLPMLRGAATGFSFGLIPGPSAVLSTFASYNLERRLSKHPAEWGHGAIEGVAGPESANNAASSAAMVPLLSLGIPFTPGVALLLAALVMHGVQPGPMLILNHPDIFWGVVASMYIGNVVLLILNLPLVGLWVSLLRLPQSLLLASIVVLCMVGAYSVNNSLLDLGVMLVMGILGYLFRKLRFDVAPIVMAVVLGPILEATFRESLFISRGDPLIFFERPISAALLSVLFLVMVVPGMWRLVTSRRKSVFSSIQDHE